MTLTLTRAIAGCNRQYVVTVNNQSVYDPRIPAGLMQLTDPSLQGCVNLALAQQNIDTAADLGVLSCANAEVSDLRGIEQFRSLRFLDLAGNNILLNPDGTPRTMLQQFLNLFYDGNSAMNNELLTLVFGDTISWDRLLHPKDTVVGYMLIPIATESKFLEMYATNYGN